jgi:hypothetical protein
MSGTHKELTEKLIREPIELFYNQSKMDDSDIEPESGWPSWAFSNHDVRGGPTLLDRFAAKLSYNFVC